MALTLIEVMPMGDIGEGRIDQYVPLSLVRARLAKQYTLSDLDDDTGGPARYVRVSETGGKLGFITPMTRNFCESCNRVRITCTGTLHTCLGHEDASDRLTPVRRLRASAKGSPRARGYSPSLSTNFQLTAPPRAGMLRLLRCLPGWISRCA